MSLSPRSENRDAPSKALINKSLKSLSRDSGDGEDASETDESEDEWVPPPKKAKGGKARTSSKLTEEKSRVRVSQLQEDMNALSIKGEQAKGSAASKSQAEGPPLNAADEEGEDEDEYVPLQKKKKRLVIISFSITCTNFL